MGSYISVSFVLFTNDIKLTIQLDILEGHISGWNVILGCRT